MASPFISSDSAFESKKIQVQILVKQNDEVISFEDKFRNDFYQKRIPLVLKSLEIGSCLEKWTWQYLQTTCGNKPVKIHVSSSSKMDFINKNFLYRTLPFDEFIQRVSQAEQNVPFISQDEKYYLRSIGDNPRKEVCDIRKIFPQISADLKFPLLFDDSAFFSSVFRISSQGLQLWTHYDIMDNILMVVSGTKRVVLYHPDDAQYLYMNGDKSEVLDIDNSDLDKYPLFSQATPHECILQKGDVLFIPALWFHNVLNLESGVAVNVFWRHLESSHYDSNDMYGNKDLLEATRADEILDRAFRKLDGLPSEYLNFYAKRMITKIQAKLLCKTNDFKSTNEIYMQNK